MLPLLLAIAGLFSLFALLDFIWRPRDFPRSPFWRLRGVAALVLYFSVAFLSPLLWDAWLASHRLIDLTALPFAAQFILGLLVLELGVYVWHRTLHRTDFLWRHMHQTHHSAERLDVWGAFYFHPLDMLGWAFLGSLCLVGAVGLKPEAAIAVNLTTVFMAMFTHANIRTPHWVGWFVARPEMHAVHHERGVHRYNFADVPWFDMLFGTYRNPKTWNERAGFFDGASLKLWPLLIGKKLA